MLYLQGTFEPIIFLLLQSLLSSPPIMTPKRTYCKENGGRERKIDILQGSKYNFSSLVPIIFHRQYPNSMYTIFQKIQILYKSNGLILLLISKSQNDLHQIQYDIARYQSQYQFQLLHILQIDHSHVGATQRYKVCVQMKDVPQYRKTYSSLRVVVLLMHSCIFSRLISNVYINNNLHKNIHHDKFIS